MKLPNLPKVLNKREANWTTTVFRKWLLENYHTLGGSTFEVKHTRGKEYLAFSEVKPSQVAKMLKIRHEKYVWKNPDFGEETPPDIFFFNQAPVYIVIKYPKGFVGIAIDKFILENKQNKRHSLLWSRAVEIASFVGK